MSAPPGPASLDPAADAMRRKRLARIVRVSMVAVLGAVTLWLVIELDMARRAQNCLESGSRKCRVIDVK
jgi:hypothetical protein